MASSSQHSLDRDACGCRRSRYHASHIRFRSISRKNVYRKLLKGEWWAANHEVHSCTVEGPLVAGSHFTCTFKLDVTFKPQSRRFVMEEVAVYKVVGGKVVYEEFFYDMG